MLEEDQMTGTNKNQGSEGQGRRPYLKKFLNIWNLVACGVGGVEPGGVVPVGVVALVGVTVPLVAAVSFNGNFNPLPNSAVYIGFRFN